MEPDPSSYGPLTDWCARHPRADRHLGLYGTAVPAAIAAWIDRASQSLLGSGVSSMLSYQWGQVATTAVMLTDGRAAALKIYPSNYERPDVLIDCRRAQAHWANLGLPVPQPLAGPMAHLGAWLVADEYRPGRPAPGDDECARQVAAGLLGRLLASGPQPHSLGALAGSRLARHPLDRSREGMPGDLVEVYERALDAAESSTDSGAVLAAHLDWRTQNIGWHNDEIAAVYDWDSTVLSTESRAVGAAAGMYAYDFTALERVVPSPEAIAAFITDSTARSLTGRFQAREASALALARFAGYALTEAELDPTEKNLGPWSFRTALSRRRSDYLALLD